MALLVLEIGTFNKTNSQQKKTYHYYRDILQLRQIYINLLQYSIFVYCCK